MEERKRDLLLSRIQKRMRVLKLATPEEYLFYLINHQEEIQFFVNLATTNETLFFRTPAIWEYFKTDFLASWAVKNPKSTLRVWSAASSSGEEACSIAILCEEYRRLNPEFKYRVYGSDISTDVLEQARKGLFKAKSVEMLKEKFSDFYFKYFKPAAEEGRFQLAEEILANMEFASHNLHNVPLKNGFYDIVFLRNVMIYFSDPDQELVLTHIYSSLKSEGILIVGESESLARLKNNFQFFKPLIYRKSA